MRRFFHAIASLAALLAAGCTTVSRPPADGTSLARDRGQPSAGTRDAFVLLSGGGTPLSNHYSQYLQARALAGFLTRDYPAESVWVFFGIGNRPDARAEIADVRHVITRDGRAVESWLPGVLPRNRPATRASFLKTLREEILPVVRDGGTLYLFVGDHGELTSGDDSESAITMWQLKRGSRRRGTWTTDESEILTVAELRDAIAQGIGRGRVLFCMTQCHSGGFHYLGIPREVVPPANWFSSMPEWARAIRNTPALRVAGFTATDEASLAAGCVPDPDPESWLGYERFAPESIIGVDLMTGAALGPPRRSLADAHEAATLVDATIDKPRATSEEYLERWATLIETRLANELRLTERTRAAVLAYREAVDRGRVAAANVGLQARSEQFARYTMQLTEQNIAAKELLLHGTRQQLEAATRGDTGGRGGGRGRSRRGIMAEGRRAWTETVRPAWKAVVLAGDPGVLSGAALDFEKQLLELEDGGRNFLLPRHGDEDAMLNEVYWGSTYAEPPLFDPAKANAVTRWAAERAERILQWAMAAPDGNVRAAAAKIEAAIASRAPAELEARTPGNLISRSTAAERVLFYRRVLAAWEFLIAMDDKPALARLQELLEIEHTPLPPPST